MLGLLRDVAPRVLVASTVGWAAINYVIAGPGIGGRIAHFDHVPACERNHEAMALAAAKERTAELPSPSGDPVKDMAAKQLRKMMDNPLIQVFGQMGGEFGGMLDLGGMVDVAISQQEQAARAARDAYDRSLERLKRETASSIANVGTTCSCLAHAAVEATRTEWAIFTGTLTLVRPALLQDFDRRMTEAYASGRCTGIAKVSP